LIFIDFSGDYTQNSSAFAKAYWQCKGKGTKKSIKQKQNN